MGVAALVLGIITIVLAFIPFIKVVAIITGILALIFGIVDLVVNKQSGKKFSKGLVGIILALCSVWVMFISTIFSIIMLAAVVEEYDDYDYEYYDECEKYGVYDWECNDYYSDYDYNIKKNKFNTKY